jgi:hypothetical protein
MPCPTCDHAMHKIGPLGTRIFWCPRCGTVTREFNVNDPDTFIPKLPQRVRDYVKGLEGEERAAAWRIGLVESCSIVDYGYFKRGDLPATF